MAALSKTQVAKLLGIRPDTFKKNLRAGVYDHLIGDVERDARGWRRFTPEQVGRLVAWYGGAEVGLRCIAMGGGVQSTTMLLMQLHGDWQPAATCAMFVDLGWESRATYENLRRLERLCAERSFPFHWIATRNIREDLLDATRDRARMVQSPPLFLRTAGGTRAQLARNCTGTYKVEVMRVKLRELLGIPARSWMRQRVEVWLGITTDEAHRLNNHSRTPWLINRFPLTDKGLSREDCVQWLTAHGYPVPPKSACLGCPYRPDSDWLEMKTTRSDEWASVVEVDRSLRAGINKVHTPLYLHPSLQPLEDVPLQGNRHRGLWGEECSGHCAT